MSFKKLIQGQPRLKKTIKWLYTLLGGMLGKFGPRVELKAGVSLSRFFAESDLFFGYYDLNPISKNSLLAHRISGDEAHILSIDVVDGHIQEIGKTRAWNLQQGARVGWRGDVTNEVYFNTIESNSVKTCLVNMVDGEKQLLDTSLHVVNQKFDKIISVNISQINRYNPEYGYTALKQPMNKNDVRDDQDCGIQVYNKSSGQSECLIALDKILSYGDSEGANSTNSEINHITFSPDENHLAFIHRWYLKNGKRKSRLLIYDFRSQLISNALANGMVSHYCWQDDNKLFIYGAASDGRDCFLTYDLSSNATLIHSALSGYGDGHPSLSPDGERIVFDSYPGISRHQNLYIYHLTRSEVTKIGSFYSPPKFSNSQRCDLHPRWSSTDQIVIDTTHTGKREISIIDISDID